MDISFHHFHFISHFDPGGERLERNGKIIKERLFAEFQTRSDSLLCKLLCVTSNIAVFKIISGEKNF